MKIAICGLMRSGKDSVGNYLVKNYGYNRLAFGDGIRTTIQLLFPERLEDGQKPRELLQGLGQGLRQFDENVWVNFYDRAVKRSKNDKIVCTDLRQPNEYQYLREQGYIIIRIDTDLNRRLQNMKKENDNFTYEDLLHETESHIVDFEVDYVLKNNGDIQHLFDQVDLMMEAVMVHE